MLEISLPKIYLFIDNFFKKIEKKNAVLWIFLFYNENNFKKKHYKFFTLKFFYLGLFKILNIFVPISQWVFFKYLYCLEHFFNKLKKVLTTYLDSRTSVRLYTFSYTKIKSRLIRFTYLIKRKSYMWTFFISKE